MTRATRSPFPFFRAIPRIVLLAAVLFSPLVAMQWVEAVQAGTGSIIIESSHRPPTGIGLVILTGLLRS